MTHALLCFGRVDLLARNIEVTGEHDLFPQRLEVADAGVKGSEEAVAEVVTKTVAVGGAVDAKEHEGRELEHDAAAFGIQVSSIDAESIDLGGGRVAADVFIRGQVSVGGGRGGWA